MMRRNLLVVVLLILTAFGASTAWAELTPEKVKAAEALIKQLSVDEFEVRQQALEKLVELGVEVPEAAEALNAAQDAHAKAVEARQELDYESAYKQGAEALVHCRALQSACMRHSWNMAAKPRGVRFRGGTGGTGGRLLQTTLSSWAR